MREGSDSVEEVFGLLNQFEHILEADPLIDEIGFIHQSQFASLDEESGSSHTSDNSELQLIAQISGSSVNKGFWIRDHKLGISTQILLPLYKAAKTVFMDAIGKYKMLRNLSDDYESESLSCALESEVMKHSRALLLLSCDFGTAWNARKLVLSKKQKLSLFINELLLSRLVLTYSQKSEQSWNHRRWIIKMISGKFLTLSEIIEKESELVEKIAERSKMNYRAWNHRCWLVSYMTSEQVLNEFKKSKTWTGLHVADSSCFHYRRRLMHKILESCNKIESESSSCNTQAYQIWKEELDWNKELIKRYVGRESLWLHRRFLSLCWVKHFASELHGVQCQTEQNISVDSKIATFMDDEICLLNSCTIIPDNEFEDFQAQALFAATYILWLTKQIPTLEEKIATEKLKAILNAACLERSSLWDHFLPEK